MEENIRLLKPYLRGLPFIILAMVGCFMFAKKYLTYVTPMYESTAKLKLADVNHGMPSSNLFKDFDIFATSSKIATEIEVLKSENIISKTLDKLDFDLEIYRKGKIRTVELYNQSPVSIQYFNILDGIYDKVVDFTIQDSIHFHFTDPLTKEIYEGTFGDTLEMVSLSLVCNLNYNYLRKNPNRKLADDYQMKILSRERLLKTLVKELDISAIDKDVPIIRIIFKSAVPEKTAKICNTLIDVYIDDYIENKYKTAETTVRFLNTRITDILDKLSQSETDIQEFRERLSITNLRQEVETDLRQIAQMEIQKTNLKMSLEAIRNLENYIKKGRDNFLELAPNFEAFSDLLSTEIVKKIKTLQGEKKDLLIKYTPDNEKVIAINGKLKDLTSYLEESITNTRKNLETKYNKIDEQILENKKVFIGIPEKEKALKILDREFAIFQKTYNFLNEKKMDAEIVQAAKISFHRVISRAIVPTKAVSPNRTIITIVSTILGMFFAIILIFIVHLLKAKVNDKYTIESNSLIPIAVFTPRLKHEKTRKDHFQKLATELEIKKLANPNGIISFNFFDPKHGAKYNAFHLAKAMALQNKKVLFIDVANLMNISNNEKDTPVNLATNIDMITMTDDKFNLYTAQKMENFLASFKKQYDSIILLNEKIRERKCVLLMSLSSTNFVVLDTRLTRAKKIMLVDLLKEEFDLPNMHFLLNRFGYNPNLIGEIFGMIRCALRGITNIRK